MTGYRQCGAPRIRWQRQCAGDAVRDRLEVRNPGDFMRRCREAGLSEPMLRVTDGFAVSAIWIR